MPREVITGLGTRIRERRLAKNWKQSALARKAGISTSHLCELETTEGISPSALVLGRIALALGADIFELLGLPVPREEASSRWEVPLSLQRAKAYYRLADDEVTLLSTIAYRGQKPQNEEDWFFLIQAIRRAVGR